MKTELVGVWAGEQIGEMQLKNIRERSGWEGRWEILGKGGGGRWQRGIGREWNKRNSSNNIELREYYLLARYVHTQQWTTTYFDCDAIWFRNHDARDLRNRWRWDYLFRFFSHWDCLFSKVVGCIFLSNSPLHNHSHWTGSQDKFLQFTITKSKFSMKIDKKLLKLNEINISEHF